jgi:Leucine-rich repeat (LRR) protein
MPPVPAGVFATAEPAARSRDVVIDFGGSSSSDAGWWEVVELHTLTLSHNALSALPAAVGALAGLTLLDLSNNRLTLVRRA